jgi:MFS family permease
MYKFKDLVTPIVSLVILTLGSALLTTFLTLRLHNLGVNSFIIGGLSTAYYGGMVIGAFKLEVIILRVGHIRTYSACASILAVASLLHGFYVNGYFWLVLRFIEGIATAGLYIVIESWILSTSDDKSRGSALALYMIALYLAQSIGQWLLNIGHQDTLIIYAVSSMFAALSVIPLALTSTEMPSFMEPDTLSIKRMFKLSPAGVTTCFASGLILGSLYGLFPAYIQHLGFSMSGISTIMGLTILGGMLFQYPFGRLSDWMSRRYVIAILALITASISATLLYLPLLSLWQMGTISFFLGGAIFCLYPIGISHACDIIDSNQIISATQTLLLAYGVGATLGPLIAPIGNLYAPGSGILIFIILISTPLCVYMLWRKRAGKSIASEDKQDFTLSVEMTPVAIELDPRAETNDTIEEQ